MCSSGMRQNSTVMRASEYNTRNSPVGASSGRGREVYHQMMTNSSRPSSPAS